MPWFWCHWWASQGLGVHSCCRGQLGGWQFPLEGVCKHSEAWLAWCMWVGGGWGARWGFKWFAYLKEWGGDCQVSWVFSSFEYLMWRLWFLRAFFPCWGRASQPFCFQSTLYLLTLIIVTIVDRIMAPKDDLILIPRIWICSFTWQKTLCRYDWVKDPEMGRLSSFSGWVPECFWDGCVTTMFLWEGHTQESELEENGESCFEEGGRGHKPRDTGGHEKQKKGKEMDSPLRVSPEGTSPLHLDFH